MQKYLFSSVDNLSVGKLRTDGYLKALADNLFLNKTIVLRTDSGGEDLNFFFQKNLKNN
jgi:LacI family transcriptional regulator